MSHWQERPLLAILILLFIFGFLYFFRLGQPSLWEEDEAIYAEIGREMFESGDLVGTFFSYTPRFDKPPLTFWLMALAYCLFGVNEFAVRFFSAVLGLAGLFLLYAMIRKTHGQQVACSSALILGSCLEYPLLAMGGVTDIPLTFFTILTFYGLWRAYLHEEPWSYLLAGFAAALATLTKGPIGLFLPGGTFALLVAIDLFTRHPVRRKIFCLPLLLAFILYLILVIPWYLAMWHRFGQDFLAQNFGYHMFTRFTRAIESHGGPFYYYLLLIFVALLPWSAGLIGGIREAFTRRRERINLLLLTWLGFYLFFFSLSRTKLPNYLLPALPPAAVCTALWWEKFREKQQAGRERWFLPMALIGTGILMAGVLWTLRARVPSDYLGLYRALFFAPFVFAGLGLAMLIFILLTGRPAVIYAGFTLLAIFGWLGIKLAILPCLEPYKPTKRLAQAIAARWRPGEKIASTTHEFSGLPFYLRRKVDYVSFSEAKELLASEERGYLAARSEETERLKKEVPETVLLLDLGRGDLLSNRTD
ncbi:MAG: glycosyltransferase family 39 protein [Firmicutes bacterium]|nr:glycosyltransferase family 39 protein [Bacillota bacterium]